MNAVLWVDDPADNSITDKQKEALKYLRDICMNDHYEKIRQRARLQIETEIMAVTTYLTNTSGSSPSTTSCSASCVPTSYSNAIYNSYLPFLNSETKEKTTKTKEILELF
jgi:uncharacterized protein YerC